MLARASLQGEVGSGHPYHLHESRGKLSRGPTGDILIGACWRRRRQTAVEHERR